MTTAMPQVNPPGFTATYRHDYLTPVPRGDGTGPGIEDIYPDHKAYHGFADTSRHGTYDKTNQTIWVQNSNLVLHCHTSPTGRRLVACVVPGGYTGQRYGKWTWRMSAPDGPGVIGHKIVPLFWPSTAGGLGEWDFPEQGIGSSSPLQINLHTTDPAHAGDGNGTTIPGQDVRPFHIYDVTWTPDKAVFSLDGLARRTTHSTGKAWPPGPMRHLFQAETQLGQAPPQAAVGDVYIDWVVAYTYTPGSTR